MNKSILSLAFAALLLGGPMATAQESEPIAEVSMSDLRIQSVAADSIVFAGRILIRAKERAEIQRVSFRDVTLAGAPVFLAGFDQKFEIAANQLTTLPGELLVTAYFRDATPDALERVLASSEVRVEGTALIQVDLNFFQSVALLRRSVATQARFSGATPISFPGGTLTRDAALAAIRLARPFWPAVSTVTTGVRQTMAGPTWTEELSKQYAGSLAFVVSTYRMRDKKGQVYPFDYSCIGYRISPTQLAVPKEAIRPWEFDPRAAALAKGRKAQVIAEGTDVIVFLSGTKIEGSANLPLNGLRLSARDLRLVREADEDMDTTFVNDGTKRLKASLHRRISAKNIAILELAGPNSSGATQPPASISESGRPYWEKLAVFRATIGSAGQVGFEAMEVRARRDGTRIVLETPVDRMSIGSPVVISSGALAMVQDERGGTMLRDGLSLNGFPVASSLSGVESAPAGLWSGISRAGR